MFRIATGSVVLLAAAFCGCGPTPRKAATTIAVKGTVNLDGKPMPTGQVQFSVPGEPVQQFPVSNGSFSGQANEGTNKVEFAMFKDGPPLTTDLEKKPTKVNALPSKYQFESKVTADVKAGGANEFKFEITSK